MERDRNPYFQRFKLNPHGNDYAIGDIHGHFSAVQDVLDRARFDPAVDRLFSVGDLIDRGAESVQALKWLDQPWFHAVRGNHEDYVIRYRRVDIANWIRNGGGWFQGLEPTLKEEFRSRFDSLPFAIEVETMNGPVGLVHAHCPVPAWPALPAQLKQSKKVRSQTIWSRERLESGDESVVQGVRAVVCGHCPTASVAQLGNVYFIDTAGWASQGYFTLFDLAQLRPVRICIKTK